MFPFVFVSRHTAERADKSRNITRINPSNYNKIMKNKITDTYKTDTNDTVCQINDDTLKFANI